MDHHPIDYPVGLGTKRDGRIVRVDGQHDTRMRGPDCLIDDPQIAVEDAGHPVVEGSAPDDGSGVRSVPGLLLADQCRVCHDTHLEPLQERLFRMNQFVYNDCRCGREPYTDFEGLSYIPHGWHDGAVVDDKPKKERRP